MSKLTQRATGFAVATGLALAGLAVTIEPAHAATQYSYFSANGDSSAGEKVFPAPYDCVLVENPGPPAVDPGLPGDADNPNEFNENGGPVTRSATFGATTTNNTNPADKVVGTATATSTTSLTGSGGAFSGFEVTSSGSASVQSALGAATGCHATQSAAMDTSAVVTITQPGWFIVEGSGSGIGDSATNPGEFYGGVYLQRVETSVSGNNVSYYYRQDYAPLEIADAKGDRRVRMFIERPGTFRLETYFYVAARTARNNPSPQPQTFVPSSSHTGSFHATGTFFPAGAKDGKAISTAKGKSYVKLLNRDCATNKVMAKLKKKKAKAMSKVIFSVNGKKKVTVNVAKKFPKKGLVRVPVPATTEALVKATVFLKAKGADKPTLQQAYLSCS